MKGGAARIDFANVMSAPQGGLRISVRRAFEPIERNLDHV